MFLTTTTPSLLEGRLDPHYYAPEFVANEERLNHFTRASLADLAVKETSIAYGVLKARVCESGCAMIRIQDFDDPFADVTRSVTVDMAQADEFSRSDCIEHDLLVAIGGYPGRVALVPAPPAGISRMNVNQHIARIRLDQNRVDPYVVAILFLANPGRMLLDRQVSGAVMAGVNLGDLKEIQIPIWTTDVQAYIGNKVRQAETLRARAKELISSANTFFCDIHTRTKDGWHGSWRRTIAQLSESRLDSHFYAAEPLGLVQRLSANGSVEIKKYGKLCKSGEFDESQPIQYFEIGNLDIGTGCAWSATVESNAIPTRAQRSVRPWDILVSTVRPERKNVGLVPESAGGQAVASSGFAVLRAESAELAAFIWAYLRSDAGTVQLLRWNTGAAYPAIDDDVVLKVLMPKYEREEMVQCGRQWKTIPSHFKAAKSLTEAARFLVEALIVQKVTEAELIAAHKDPERDRELLARLTTKGLDVTDAPPLFPDLDALYELLNASDEGEADA